MKSKKNVKNNRKITIDEHLEFNIIVFYETMKWILFNGKDVSSTAQVEIMKILYKIMKKMDKFPNKQRRNLLKKMSLAFPHYKYKYIKSNKNSDYANFDKIDKLVTQLWKTTNKKDIQNIEKEFLNIK